MKDKSGSHSSASSMMSGSLGRPNFLLMAALEKWKRKQEELRQELNELKTKIFFEPNKVPDINKRGETDRNGFLIFSAPDTFMKKHNLIEHIGTVLIRKGSYKYVAPVRDKDNTNSYLRQVLLRILPYELKVNIKKRLLQAQKTKIMHEIRTTPPKAHILRRMGI